MKLVSWNVNGLRAILNKDFMDSFYEFDADIFCIQETKMQKGQAEINAPEYHAYINSAEKKGYSGTAVYSRIAPVSESYGMKIAAHDTEGRIVQLEFNEFILVNVYTPNSGEALARLDYRMDWDDAFKNYICELDKIKPVIICGDLNVAHTEMDIKNAKTNHKSAGFTPQEREKMTDLLSSGFCDTFRTLHPDVSDAYTWWSFRANARERNVGWRIDYFITSERIIKNVKKAEIHPNIYGSDHCPVSIEIEF